jgi:hypothetical protein
MKLTRWSITAGLILVGFACRASTAPKSSTVVGANLVRLTVTPSATEVARGVPMTFHVSLVNEGGSPLTLHFSDSCQINPYIQNEAGQTVLPVGGGWGCATVLTDLTLMPGKGVVRDYVWTGSTEFRSELPLRPLPSGKYFFSAEVPSSEITLRATVPVVLD